MSTTTDQNKSELVEILDNSQIIRDKILKFKSPDDFYFISVMWRRKDHPECPANENARMLANWCIKNVEYFDSHLPIIKDYCEHFKARAYIKPQVRSCKDINRQLLVFLAKQVDNMDLAYSTLTREIISGCHNSRSKRIVLDIDDDIYEKLIPFDKKERHKHCFIYVNRIVDTIKKLLKKEKRKKECNDVIIVPTFNGYHIVTPGFDPGILKEFDLLSKDTWHSDNDTILYAVKSISN